MQITLLRDVTGKLVYSNKEQRGHSVDPCGIAIGITKVSEDDGPVLTVKCNL